MRRDGACQPHTATACAGVAPRPPRACGRLTARDRAPQVLLGLAQYETHNKLDNHMDMLYGGLVNNESLYLRMEYE